MCNMYFHEENALKCTLTSSSAAGVSLVVTSSRLLHAFLRDVLLARLEAVDDDNDDDEGANERAAVDTRDLRGVLQALHRHAKVVIDGVDREGGGGLPPELPLPWSEGRGGSHDDRQNHVRLEHAGHLPASAWFLASTMEASTARPRVVTQPVTPLQLRDDPRFCPIKSTRDARQAAARGALFFVFEGPPGRLQYVETSSPTDVHLVRVAVAAMAPSSPPADARRSSSSSRLVLVNLNLSCSSRADDNGGGEKDEYVEDLESLLKNDWVRLFTFPALSQDLEPLLREAAHRCIGGGKRERHHQRRCSTSRSSALPLAPPLPDPPSSAMARRTTTAAASTHTASARVRVPLGISSRSLPALAQTYLLAYVPQLGLMSDFVAAAASSSDNNNNNDSSTTSTLFSSSSPSLPPSSSSSSSSILLERWIERVPYSPPSPISGVAAEEEGGDNVDRSVFVTSEATAQISPTYSNNNNGEPACDTTPPPVAFVDVYVTTTITRPSCPPSQLPLPSSSASSSTAPPPPPPASSCSRSRSLSYSCSRSCVLQTAPARAKAEGDDDTHNDDSERRPRSGIVLVDENDHKKLRVVMSVLRCSARLLSRCSRRRRPEVAEEESPHDDDPARVLADAFCRLGDAEAVAETATAPIQTHAGRTPDGRCMQIQMTMLTTTTATTSKTTTTTTNSSAPAMTWDIGRSYLVPPAVTLDEMMLRTVTSLDSF